MSIQKYDFEAAAAPPKYGLTKSQPAHSSGFAFLAQRAISIVLGSALETIKMKRLIFTFLSTAAVCAAVSATPAAAQETITGAPAGTAPITAEPPYGPSYSPGFFGYGFAPVGAAEAVGAAIDSPDFAMQGHARCHVTQDFYGSHGRYTSVCSP
jgi:hypothetical protein